MDHRRFLLPERRPSAQKLMERVLSAFSEFRSGKPSSSSFSSDGASCGREVVPASLFNTVPASLLYTEPSFYSRNRSELYLSSNITYQIKLFKKSTTFLIPNRKKTEEIERAELEQETIRVKDIAEADIAVQELIIQRRRS
ncbi:unnamed protein product [Microthlaspi erraticum]|uniref:Uncharacterized protein n=1 Tax=Microthlaspi erraticum TaxID=1685480 RepID=A0A6D2K7B3_9BRAS|nr:unnamed protein product [Microthlaspi erraticum]